MLPGPTLLRDVDDPPEVRAHDLDLRDAAALPLRVASLALVADLVDELRDFGALYHVSLIGLWTPSFDDHVAGFQTASPSPLLLVLVVPLVACVVVPRRATSNVCKSFVRHSTFSLTIWICRVRAACSPAVAAVGVLFVQSILQLAMLTAP